MYFPRAPGPWSSLIPPLFIWGSVSICIWLIVYTVSRYTYTSTTIWWCPGIRWALRRRGCLWSRARWSEPIRTRHPWALFPYGFCPLICRTESRYLRPISKIQTGNRYFKIKRLEPGTKKKKKNRSNGSLLFQIVWWCPTNSIPWPTYEGRPIGRFWTRRPDRRWAAIGHRCTWSPDCWDGRFPVPNCSDWTWPWRVRRRCSVPPVYWSATIHIYTYEFD